MGEISAFKKAMPAIDNFFITLRLILCFIDTQYDMVVIEREDVGAYIYEEGFCEFEQPFLDPASAVLER